MTRFPAATALIQTCNADGEFRLAAKGWNGTLSLQSESSKVTIAIADGVACVPQDDNSLPESIAITGPDIVWSQLLMAKPDRFLNDIAILIGGEVLQLDADPLVYAQYYPAAARLIELLRAPYVPQPETCEPARRSGQHDSPVGRYIHLDIAGQDYRIYYEEAGSGIPLLLQHTAGCHGAQWRHLFECTAITDHFRLIAYDLPFHGKSLPPVGPRWWSEPYKLEGEFLRAVPLALAEALGLDRPVFMGCSVGGLLALDLACHHPDKFSAVVSLEGALAIDDDLENLTMLWHPKVSNEFKARLMNSLMSPTSPEAYRKETSMVYASGWPPLFLGDLHYYVKDCKLTELADRIDTSRCEVHILSGEYDASGTVEHGLAAHAAIPGSTWQEMKDVGHFPMSENPAAFLEYLLPVLGGIRNRLKRAA